LDQFFILLLFENVGSKYLETESRKAEENVFLFKKNDEFSKFSLDGVKFFKK